MSEIGNITGLSNASFENIEKQEKEKEIELSDISVLYTTKKTEDKRTSFEETFNETSLNDASQGAEFLNGLIANKDVLMDKLGLSDEQYDVLACVALGLASQETGMGFEKGYKSENTGLGAVARGIAKWFDTTSASSGLTQMKIYDFLNSDKLTQEQKSIILEFGIEAKGVAKNNLYSNPDKSAIATMVVLSSLIDNYDNYTSVLKNAHNSLSLSLNDNLSEEERIAKGENILSNVLEIYKNADDSTKVEIRSTFKQWLLSYDGSKKSDGGDKDYNEEVQLNKLNDLLGDYKLSQDDLDYIRYALTADGQEMSKTEYCAYAWNKGTEESGMKLDRLLADKVGTILANPEDFDYDQFTVNVSTLAQKYASQSIQNDINLYLDEAFEE